MPIEYDDLEDKFLGTDEGEAWDEFVQAAREALDSGKERAELPTAFLKLVLPDIAASPTMFDVMREAWNRVCDENGAPERREGQGKNRGGPAKP
jgi:hypothetical protein